MKIKQPATFIANSQTIKSIQLFVITLVVSLTTACSTFNSHNTPKLQVTKVNQLVEWQARGKVLLKNDKDKVSGYFFWHKNGDDFTLSLSSFIGTNLLKLSVKKNGLATITVDGNSYSGADPEQLIFRVTGRKIPVNMMSNWMLANIENTPYISNKQFNNDKLASFQYQKHFEAPWQVVYSSYQKADQLMLPNKMNVETTDSKIKLTINEWEFIR